jgi:hypothetical protein
MSRHAKATHLHPAGAPIHGIGAFDVSDGDPYKEQ